MTFRIVKPPFDENTARLHARITTTRRQHTTHGIVVEWEPNSKEYVFLDDANRFPNQSREYVWDVRSCFAPIMMKSAGEEKTYSPSARARYYWPTLFRDEYVPILALSPWHAQPIYLLGGKYYETSTWPSPFITKKFGLDQRRRVYSDRDRMRQIGEVLLSQ